MTTQKSGGTIGPVRAWALAAGGMVGGGIYIALGVVIEASGQWAWLSFLIAGLAAVLTAHSYAALTNRFQASGGVFDFLEEIDRKGWAGSLSWLLLLGYTLTISVYSYAFGNYVAHAFGGGPITIRVLVAGVMGGMIALNLAGAGKLTAVETVIVSVNLLILLALAGIGIWHWSPDQLSAGIAPKSLPAAWLGAAAIFVSYEGFQLLTYEYGEMKNPRNWFLPVLVSSAVFVVFVYVAVTLGATMISGAATMIERKDVALSVAAREAVGTPGLVAMTVAAAFATSAAINSTLFSTAKLTGRVADDGELPDGFGHRNGQGIPGRAVCLIGTIAAALAMLGSLSSLVEAASLVFIATFAVVNFIAARQLDGRSWPAWSGAALSTLIGVVLVYRLLNKHPWSLAMILALVVGIIFIRPKALAKCQ